MNNLPDCLTCDELERYSRHLPLPNFGLEGQKKLKQAKVLIVGTGGLGSPVALYLAAAGVGTIGLVDSDVVEVSNLQRQIIHCSRNVGRPKVESAKERINELNPFVEVKTYNLKFTPQNAGEIMQHFDIIVDATDNFQTRYLINDTCVQLGKPNVYGSAFQFDGQASVFCVENGPCLRCLHPTPPPPDMVLSGIVLGVLPGIIGTIQAMETIKLIVGGVESLTGRLFVFDTWRMRVRILNLQKDQTCSVCANSVSSFPLD